jgi:hypothetical protein
VNKKSIGQYQKAAILTDRLVSTIAPPFSPIRNTKNYIKFNLSDIIRHHIKQSFVGNLGGFMQPANRSILLKVFAALCFIFVFFAAAQNAWAVHVIAGTVFDKGRNPIPDLDVELQDEYYRAIQGARQKTSSSGRYEFSVNNEGRYYVKVYAFRYDLVDEVHEVYISSVSAVPGQAGSSYNIEDFYLQPKKGGLAETELSVVFAQSVPKDAQKLYIAALDQFSKKKTADGIMSLVSAVQVFPDYYMALQRLTRELFALNKFVETFQYSRRTVEVNPKSAMGYYYMGSALRHLGKEYGKAAITALSEAARLAPGSQQVLFVLGKTEREQGSFLDAEHHLIAAKKLSTVKSPEINIELSQLYANDLKKYGEAADELEQYIKASRMNGDEEKALREKVAELRTKAKTQSAN